MQVPTNTPDILFVTETEGDSAQTVSGARMTISHVTWDGQVDTLGERTPDCVLVSDALGTEQACEIARTVRQEQSTATVVAFVGDRTEAIEALFDAGVTEVIRSTVAESSPRLLERRIESALALAGQPRHGEPVADERADSESDPLVRDVIESINDVVWVNSPDADGLEYVNSAYEDVWGRPRDELYEDREAILETVHPTDRERVREAMERQLDRPEEYDETYRVVRPDGEQRWVHSRAVGIRESGQLERIVGIATDITEAKTHQQQLATERDLVERILETNPVGIVVIDTSGVIVRANEQAGTILGVSKSELEGDQYTPQSVGICEMDGQELPESEFPYARIKSTGEPVRNEQYIVDNPDGENIVITVDGVPLCDEGELERIVITFDDVTGQVNREGRLEKQRDELAELNHINRIIRGVHRALLHTETREEILQAVCENLTMTDRYRYATALQPVGESRLEATAWTDGAEAFVDAICPITAATNGPAGKALTANETQVVPDVESSPALNGEWVETLRGADIRSFATIPVVHEGSEFGVISVFSPEEDVFGERKRSVLDELGETIGHAIAAAESRQRERTLTSLYQATEEFLAAETARDISEVAVDTATDVLELPGIGIFLFNEQTNLLAPVAGTDTFLDFFGESPVFGPGNEDSITWHTYVTGETRCFTDVQESDRLAYPDTSARATLLIPLGEHGVFVAASDDIGVFDEQKRQLVGLLGATTEAALDRVAGQADIRERDEALEARSQRLEQLEQLLSISQEIADVIRVSATRTELERELCDRLVSYDCLSFVWVGHRSGREHELEPRVWAGADDGYLDAVSMGLDGVEPALRAAAGGEAVRVPNVTADIREKDWAREAIDRGYQSVLAVPLADGDTEYGVIAVYATEPDAFGERVEAVATEFGATIAHGINSVETRRGILAEQETAIDVHLGETDTLLNAVAALVDEPVSYREVTPMEDSTTQILFTLTDPPVEEILALESEFVGVESLTHTKRGANDLFRATVSGQTVAGELLDQGGIPQEVTAGAHETRAEVILSEVLDVREFLDRLRERYPGTELRSRQEVEQHDSEDDVRRALEERLTDRQREVLVSAYESGFFQSPRETTGEELAALLGISQPTLTHHLREAQHRLFRAVLDEG